MVRLFNFLQVFSFSLSHLGLGIFGAKHELLHGYDIKDLSRLSHLIKVLCMETIASGGCTKTMRNFHLLHASTQYLSFREKG